MKIFKSNRKAFTLVELLIVIAIIGILFVVLVSKVDFATDKAKTTGVQTDFRSFQVAFETVSRENAGFNTLGWDTGDKADNALIAGYTYENADKDAGDRVRNSYDKGDMNLNGICEEGETWTGQKMYTETWTGVYTLDNPEDATDMSAYLALEKAINKNLDPALQISIDPENKTIYMANGYQDPWKTEYHGVYLSNAANDGMDRGAIVMYSDGPNKVFGSEQTISKGKVTVSVKNGGINGQDDLALVTCYTYMNGYGEVTTITEGFSNNQVLNGNSNAGVGDTEIQISGKTYAFNEELTNRTYDFSDPETYLEFFVDTDIKNLRDVLVDGTSIDSYNYLTDGNLQHTKMLVELPFFYLQTLSLGTHNIEIKFTDGSAKTEFMLSGTSTCAHANAGYACSKFISTSQCASYYYCYQCRAIIHYAFHEHQEYSIPEYETIDINNHKTLYTCEYCYGVIRESVEVHIADEYNLVQDETENVHYKTCDCGQVLYDNPIDCTGYTFYSNEGHTNIHYPKCRCGRVFLDSPSACYGDNPGYGSWTCNGCGQCRGHKEPNLSSCNGSGYHPNYYYCYYCPETWDATSEIIDGYCNICNYCQHTSISYASASYEGNGQHYVYSANCNMCHMDVFNFYQTCIKGDNGLCIVCGN